MLSSDSSSSLERRIVRQPNGEEASRIFDRGKQINNQGKHCTVQLDEHTTAKIFATNATNEEDEHLEEEEDSRTELDSHANMVVVGRNAVVIQESGDTVDVRPFSPDYQALKKMQVVDAAVKYTCPYSLTEYCLILRNCVHVPSMKNNLLPPFALREKGIIVNDVPKIHCDDPSIEDHSIYIPKFDVRIPLKLTGVFSYFPTSKPSLKFLEETDEVYDMTPMSWDPHNTVYANNEENMVDWEGNMREPKHRIKILLSEVEEDPAMVECMSLGVEIDKIMDVSCVNCNPGIVAKELDEYNDIIPMGANEIGSMKTVLSQISPVYEIDVMEALIRERAEVGKFMTVIGSTNATDVQGLLERGQDSEEYSDDDTMSEDTESWSSDDKDDFTSQIFSIDTADVDEFIAGAVGIKGMPLVLADHLSKIWKIDLESAKRTLDITTQHSKRVENPKMSRNYATGDRMLRYKRIHLYFYMDTFFAAGKKEGRGKSSRGHTCCQLFVTDKGFVYCVPMKSKGEVLKALKQFAKEIGAPDMIVLDASKEQTKDAVRQFLNDIGTTLKVLERHTPWANKAELYIGLMKEGVRKDLKETNSPFVFWDYCLERRMMINNLTAKDLFQLHGSNAHSSLTGDDGDISNLCTFGWYDWCYFREQSAKFPEGKEILGRVLGPARGQGNEMCQWVLKANGKVVPQRTTRPLHTDELHSPTEKRKREVFDELIERRWGTSINPPAENTPKDDEYVEYSDDDEPVRTLPEIDELEEEAGVDEVGNSINQQPVYDKYLSAEVSLQHEGQLQTGKVMRRTLGSNGNTIGKYNDLPIMNSMIYDVEFPDGQIKEYAANVIAENILSQVDDEGFGHTLLSSIVDYKKDITAVPMAEKYISINKRQPKLCKTTKGWKLLVEWKTGNRTWIPLKDLKELNPIEVAEFAKARGIATEPAFAWWVPYTLKKRDVIAHAVTARTKVKRSKYGIKIPLTIEEANQFDREMGSDCHLWRDALMLEMRNVGIAFEILDEGIAPPKGWKRASGHLVFDVKMDFTRKARWVLDGHKCANPEGSTYAGVVSRESVRICLTYAALNDLDVTGADIRNAYLQAPSSQKDFIVCGPEFGLENVGKCALIRRALYGGKAAGRDFRNHLRACMHHLDYKSCPADPDVWMRPKIKADGGKYWEYVLLYTDDVLIISENGEAVLREEIGKYFVLKEKSIGPPDIYLGGKMRKLELDNGVKTWAFGSTQYVKAAVNNVKLYLKDRNSKLPAKAETPIRTSYQPELDVTKELGPTDAAYYQSLIGILRWMVELGRIDICLEVSMLSSHLVMPREGHLEQVYHIFAYLRKYHNSELVFDPTVPEFDEEAFKRKDWTSSEFGHLSGKEEMPPNMPEFRGEGFVIWARVDADHASDTITRRSRTGFLIYINSAPVYWLSKKQNSVESSTFGSEFMAMKQCCEYIRGLRYKLRMMGIEVNGPAYIQGDNKSVLCNTSIPDSTLKKKSQSIAYHFVREGVARDKWRTAYVNTHLNPADLLTKVLPMSVKRRGFVQMLQHHIFGSFDDDVDEST